MSTKKPNTIGKFSAITFICSWPAFAVLVFTSNFISEKYVSAYFYTGGAVVVLFIISAGIWEGRRRKKLTNFKSVEDAVKFEKADKKAAELGNEIGTFAVTILICMGLFMAAMIFLSNFIGIRYAGILCYIAIALTITAISAKFIAVNRRKKRMQNTKNRNYEKDN